MTGIELQNKAIREQQKAEICEPEEDLDENLSVHSNDYSYTDEYQKQTDYEETMRNIEKWEFPKTVGAVTAFKDGVLELIKVIFYII